MKTYYEISEAPKPDGRRRVKLVLHEIHPDNTHYNLNGITYLEEYTRKNADSIIGMPLCASFLDEIKDVPYDHGMTGEDGCMPVFEDSEQVGVADNWSIEDKLIDGEMKRVCCCEGYINQQRYPNFVKWLEDNLTIGNTVYGSVEFVGTEENKNIVYLDGYKETGRIPTEYVYSGYCILSVKPSDNAAILIELNQKQNESEENIIMDEKAIAQLVDSVKSTIIETNSKNSEFEAKITELNAQIETKNKEIEELNATKTKIEEENAEKDKVLSEKNALVESVTAELEECKKVNRINELNEALSTYSTEEKDFAKEEIEKFNADTNSVEINSIVMKIDATIGKKTKEAQISEINQKKSEVTVDDIFSSVDSVSTEEVISLDGIFA